MEDNSGTIRGQLWDNSGTAPGQLGDNFTYSRLKYSDCYNPLCTDIIHRCLHGRCRRILDVISSKLLFTCLCIVMYDTYLPIRFCLHLFVTKMGRWNF